MLSQSARYASMRGKRACNANARGRLTFAARQPIDLIEIKEIIVVLRAALNGGAQACHPSKFSPVWYICEFTRRRNTRRIFSHPCEYTTHPLIVSHLAEFPETLCHKASLLDRGAIPKRLCKAASIRRPSERATRCSLVAKSLRCDWLR